MYHPAGNSYSRHQPSQSLPVLLLLLDLLPILDLLLLLPMSQLRAGSNPRPQQRLSHRGMSQSLVGRRNYAHLPLAGSSNC